MQNGYLSLEKHAFNEWVDFIFAYLSNQEFQNEWFQEEGYLIRFGDNFAKNCIRLFNDPEILLERYTTKQIEQGFEFILNPLSIQTWLWSRDSNSQIRREFILSMKSIFNVIFAAHKMENVCFMWWDYLRGFDDDKDLQVFDWMFESLSQMLEIDSTDCQMSALHGLGHIEHRGKRKLIENFLRKHPNFAEKDYALAAIEGNVL